MASVTTREWRYEDGPHGDVMGINVPPSHPPPHEVKEKEHGGCLGMLVSKPWLGPKVRYAFEVSHCEEGGLLSRGREADRRGSVAWPRWKRNEIHGECLGENQISWDYILARGSKEIEGLRNSCPWRAF